MRRKQRSKVPFALGITIALIATFSRVGWATNDSRPTIVAPIPPTRENAARVTGIRAANKVPGLPAGAWRPLGPAGIGPNFLLLGGFYGGVNSGRATAVVTIPSGRHAGRVVLGSAGGGIWTSDDNGTTWTPRSDDAASLAIGSLAEDAAHADHLIAGTGEGNNSEDSYPGFGVLSSNDGGDTWTLQNPGNIFSNSHIGGVAIDPANAAHMFAGTDVGLYVTTNGGATWNHPSDPSYATVDGDITSVVIDPSTPNNVYLGGGHASVAKSIDGGQHWAPANTGIVPGGRLIALGLAASSPTTLYASSGSFVAPVALYRTTNGGATWTHLTATPDYAGALYSYGAGSGTQGWYDNTVAVDPTDPNHVIAGGIALVESRDGGATWTNLNGHSFFAGTNVLHPDQHALAFRPDGTVLIANDGGLYRYDPSSTAVSNANGNLNITQFYFGFNVVNGTLLAGSQDNGSARSIGSNLGPWTGVWVGDGGPSAITPNSPNLQFIESNQRVLRTTDAFASTFDDITPPQLGLFTPPMIVVPNQTDPNDPTVFYGGPVLYRTTNPSAATPTWTQVTSAGGIVSAIAAAKSDQRVIYVGFTDGTIQVSRDGGVTFTTLPRLTFSDGASFVTGISVDQGNPKAISVSVSTSRTRFFFEAPHVALYAWTARPDSGSWSDATGDLPAYAAVSRVVSEHGTYIAATDAGVYATRNAAGPSTTWVPLGTGLPNVQVQDLDLEPEGIYAVTHGRGAWMLPTGGPPRP